jgi:hypothetical protein
MLAPMVQIVAKLIDSIFEAAERVLKAKVRGASNHGFARMNTDRGRAISNKHNSLQRHRDIGSQEIYALNVRWP